MTKDHERRRENSNPYDVAHALVEIARDQHMPSRRYIVSEHHAESIRLSQNLSLLETVIQVSSAKESRRRQAITVFHERDTTDPTTHQDEVEVVKYLLKPDGSVLIHSLSPVAGTMRTEWRETEATPEAVLDLAASLSTSQLMQLAD